MARIEARSQCVDDPPSPNSCHGRRVLHRMNKSTNTEQQVEPRPLIEIWGFRASRHVCSAGHPRRGGNPISISILLTNGCSKHHGTNFSDLNDAIEKIQLPFSAPSSEIKFLWTFAPTEQPPNNASTTLSALSSISSSPCAAAPPSPRRWNPCLR